MRVILPMAKKEVNPMIQHRASWICPFVNTLGHMLNVIRRNRSRGGRILAVPGRARREEGGSRVGGCFGFSTSNSLTDYSPMKGQLIHSTQPLHREFQQIQLSPSPGVVGNISWILAADRTTRPDPLDNLHMHRNGWDIHSRHYWASVGFTGLPGFLLALLWIALGLLFLLFLSFFCCVGQHGKEQSVKNPQTFRVLFFSLLIFTCLVIVGCFFVYFGQEELHGDLSDTLEYVVNQSQITVENLDFVSSILMQSTTIDVSNLVIPKSEQETIQQQSIQLNSSAYLLKIETETNAHQIRRAIENARLSMIVVAGVMLLLVLLGISSTAFGLRPIIYSLVIIGWLSIASTCILCGVFIMLNNAVGDACDAMQEWVVHPEVHTNLDEILPCVDQQTTNNTLNHSKNMTNTLVDVTNQAINRIFNNNFTSGMPFYFNQSGPKVPRLCAPYGAAPGYADQTCPAGYVDFKTAPQTWSHFVCTEANGVCTSSGRLTPEIYGELLKSVRVADGLIERVPFLVSVENCEFARTTFQHIIDGHCSLLQRHLKWVWIGLILVSGGSMISLVLWVLCSENYPKLIITHHKSSEQEYSEAI